MSIIDLIDYKAEPLLVYRPQLSILYLLMTKDMPAIPKNIEDFIKKYKTKLFAKDFIHYWRNRNKKKEEKPIDNNKKKLHHRNIGGDLNLELTTTTLATTTDSVVSIVSPKLSPVQSEDSVAYLIDYIDYNIGVPAKYQLLVNAKSGQPIVFAYPELLALDLSAGYESIIPAIKTSGVISMLNYMMRRDINCILLFDISYELEPQIEYLRSMSEESIKQLYYTKYAIYHPELAIDDFVNAAAGKFQDKSSVEPSKNSYIVGLRNITAKEIKMRMKYDKPSVINKKTTIRFDNDINLVKFFDKFVLTATLPYMILKFDENTAYIKYIGKKPKFTLPYSPSIVIANDDIIIYPNGRVVYKIKHFYDTLHKYLPDHNIVTITDTKDYSYKISSSIALDGIFIKNMIAYYEPILEMTYSNFVSRNTISFYYKPIDLVETIRYKSKYYTQNGSAINITFGETIYNVIFKNVTNIADATNIFNFLMRFLYKSMIYFIKKETYNDRIDYKNISKANILKNIDPMLFNPKNTADSKGFKFADYARVAQKEKQPIAFYADAPTLRDYLKKNKYIKPENMMVIDNHTYKDENDEPRKTVYICDDKRNRYPSFLPKLTGNDKKCLPVCNIIRRDMTKFHNLCIKNVFSEIAEETSTNLYYIRKYNPEYQLPNHKLAYLPTKLRNYLIDRNHCKINYNVLMKKSKCTLLMGYKKLATLFEIHNINYTGKNITPNNENKIINYIFSRHKIFTVIFVERNDSIAIANNFDNYSFINGVSNYKCLFLLKSVGKFETYYSCIINLEFKQKKLYQINTIHQNKVINERIIKLFNNIITTETTTYHHITLYDLIKKRIFFKQIVNEETNVVYNVIIDDVVLPIIPSLPNSYYPIVTKEFTNNIFDVIKVLTKLPKLKIHSYMIAIDNVLFGFKLTSGYMILFKPVNYEEVAKDIPKNYHLEHIYSKIRDNHSYNTSLPVEIELYYLLLMHLSYYINESFIDKTKTVAKFDQWNGWLVEAFGSNMELINSEITKIYTKKFKKMEYFKLNKRILLGTANNSIVNIFHEILDPHISFDQLANFTLSSKKTRIIEPANNTGTIVDQYVGNKLRFPQNLYNSYLNFIAEEYIVNEMKRYQLLNNQFPELTNLFEFKSTKDYKIERI